MTRTKYKTIKERFRALRAELDTMEKDCTQDMLSKQIYIQKPQISELENGKRLPSINELKAYSKFFNVPMEYFIGESDSRYYNNITTTKDLGLSDDVVNALKLWKEKAPKCNIIFILNQIFKIGYGYSFLNALSHYFYGVCREIQMTEYKTEGEILKFNEIKGNSINILGESSAKLSSINKKDIEYIFQQKLYDLLSIIKKELNTQGLECESELYNGFDSNACLSEFYENLDETITDKKFVEYLNNIRSIKNGKHSTKKKQRR